MAVLTDFVSTTTLCINKPVYSGHVATQVIIVVLAQGQR